MHYKNFNIELADGTKLSLPVNFEMLDVFMRDRVHEIDQLPSFNLRQLMQPTEAIRPVQDVLRRFTLDLYTEDVVPTDAEHTTVFTFAMALVYLWKTNRIIPGEETPMRLH